MKFKFFKKRNATDEFKTLMEVFKELNEQENDEISGDVEEAMYKILNDIHIAEDGSEIASLAEAVSTLNEVRLRNKFDKDLIEMILRVSDSKRKQSIFRHEMFLPVIANLTGILLVLNYEKVNIVTSKAFGMIVSLKGRV